MIGWMACALDPDDPEVAWSRIHRVEPLIPWLVSQCVAGRSDPRPEVRGVEEYGVSFEAASCRPVSVYIHPEDAHEGWFLGDTHEYRREFDGTTPPGGPGFGIETIGTWYIRSTDDY